MAVTCKGLHIQLSQLHGSLNDSVLADAAALTKQFIRYLLHPV